MGRNKPDVPGNAREIILWPGRGHRLGCDETALIPEDWVVRKAGDRNDRAR